MGKKTAKGAADTGGKLVEIVTRTTERRTGDEGETEISVEPGADGDEDVLAALDDLGDSGARLEIRRTSPAEFAGYVGTYSRDGWTPDRLMDEWGGGKFTIRVRSGDGSFLGMRHVQIAGKSKNKQEPPMLLPAIAAAPLPPQPVDQSAMVRAVTDSMKPTVDMLSRLVEALINKQPPPPPPPGPDMLTVLEKARAIFKPDKSSDEGGAVAMLLKGLELGRHLDEGAGGASMADVFLKGFDTIKQAVALQPRPSQRRIAPPAPGTVAATAAAPAEPAQPAAAPNNPPKPPASDSDKQLKWITQQVAFLVHQAKRSKDPELYAELFLDNLPPFLPEELVLAQMKDPDAVTNLSFVNAEVPALAPWFEKFRAAIVEFLEGEDADEGEEQAQPPPDIEMPEHETGGDGMGS